MKPKIGRSLPHHRAGWNFVSYEKKITVSRITHDSTQAVPAAAGESKERMMNEFEDWGKKKESTFTPVFPFPHSRK